MLEGKASVIAGTFKAGEDFYLIEPFKEIKINKRVTVPAETPKPIDPENLDEVQDAAPAETKQVTKKVPANFQLGRVLVKPQAEKAKFEVGEVVVYRGRTGEDFDLIKGSKLIRWFEIIGLWVDETIPAI